jgi:pyridoxamine 5'-phosphate oxidase
MSLEGDPSIVDSKLDSPFDNPMLMFSHWADEAKRVNVKEPYGMVLSTTGAPNSSPNSRVVLLKEYNENGLFFCTSANSQKGQELNLNPYVSCCFWWRETMQQIIMNGKTTRLDETFSDRLFDLRPQGAKIVSYVSSQSKLMKNESELKRQIESLVNEKIVRPEDWFAYFIEVTKCEFWIGSKDRFHTRLLYIYDNKINKWNHCKLQP